MQSCTSLDSLNHGLDDLIIGNSYIHNNRLFKGVRSMCQNSDETDSLVAVRIHVAEKVGVAKYID